VAVGRHSNQASEGLLVVWNAGEITGAAADTMEEENLKEGW
jgi:phosphoglycerate dehydrogenase-like enzyme